MAQATSQSPVRYKLESDGTFVIKNYNQSNPFSNFFPGVAGVWGIPMWVFYVNRGQCISSFGIEGKDKALLEFQPANKAYRLTSLQGFRTFIKATTKGTTHFWEPFQSNGNSKNASTQTMSVTSHDLTISDVNEKLGLKVTVNYFTLPEESFPALIRQVTVHRIDAKKLPLKIEMIDGLPVFMPYGLKDWTVKNMSRTAEAWVRIKNLNGNAPYVQLNIEVSDTPDVNYVTEGNFFFSYESSEKTSTAAKRGKLLKCIVDASCVFGQSLDFLQPENFLRQKKFTIPAKQQTLNRTPSAMNYTKFSLSSGQHKEMTSVFGHAYSEKQLIDLVKDVTAAPNYMSLKARENKKIVDGIKAHALTVSSNERLNQYCQQTFLDNVLRGGLPISLMTQEEKVAFNVFSRKHGDPERDYNYFVLSPTYYSQGNGNYRDVNQNRRNDIWFNGDVLDSGIIDLLNLIQADGYNPLVIRGMRFSFGSTGQTFGKNVSQKDYYKVMSIIKGCCETKEHAKILEAHHHKRFHPGEMIEFIMRKGIRLKVTYEEFLKRVLEVCHKQIVADHGEGFWSDHWAYNLDMIESFLSVYPEALRALLMEKEVFQFYHNTHYVLPRRQRYLMTLKGVRQYHSVAKPETLALGSRDRLCDKHGNIYMTTLTVKLLCIIANKAATFDPSGIGIEMEADKPNWYDSLNGLPGLLGSSISETFELKRLCLFLLNSLKKLNLNEKDQVSLFSELSDFITTLIQCLKQETDAQDYWNRSNNAKENYRSSIRDGEIGRDLSLNVEVIKEFLQLVIRKVDGATERYASGPRLPTYFYHEVTEIGGQPFERGAELQPQILQKEFDAGKIKFVRHDLPLFLEGYVHALRIPTDRSAAQTLYRNVRKSPLYDRALKMYKVNDDLSRESEEIGRTHTFPAGWLENESIWLHMEYKFMLELLRCELYEEFYDNFQSVMIPFLDPAQYGRSVFENSSFIVSSAHEDQALHGRGFVARLSGSTAEFIHMWLWMNLGRNPFTVNDQGQLVFKLNPALAGWLFTNKKLDVKESCPFLNGKNTQLPKNTYAFNLFGSTLVVYHNPRRRNTFGAHKPSIKEIHLAYPGRDGPVILRETEISGAHARDIRARKLRRIDVFFS